MPHSISKLLLDLTLSCAEMQQFCAGKDLAAFQSDRILQLAVERQFEIIGFRNLIAHGYDIIDDASLWDFVINRVPVLFDQVQNY